MYTHPQSPRYTGHSRLIPTCCLGALLLFFHTARSQYIDPNLEHLIREEKAFATEAERSDFPSAFLMYLDSTGMVFNGSGMVNGIAEYSKVPKGGRDLLSWYPVIAHVSNAGDLGFTSGPYQYYPERGKQAARSGYFFSIWRKNAAGKFKVVFDGGVAAAGSHDGFFKRLPEPVSYGRYDYLQRIASVRDSAESVWEIEDAFVTDASKGDRALYEGILSDSVIFLRDNQPFARDRQEAEAIARQTAIGSYRFDAVSRGVSGELAYCFGKVRVTYLDKKEKSGFFVRIWQRQSAGWRIVADDIGLF